QKVVTNIGVARSVIAGDGGAFNIEGLPPGTYALVSESDGYTPAYRLSINIGEGAGQKLDQVFAGDQAIVLHPVSGALIPVVGPNVFLDGNVYFANGTDLALDVLSATAATDVGVTAFRVGADDVSTTAFEPFSVQKTITLPTREG